MPTFPAKTNYLSGDVLTAAQMVDVGNGLNDLLPDAKGSLTTVSAANTPAQLTVGNNGETLVADSSATTGLRWQGTYAAGKNRIINGAMLFDQRNSGSAVTINAAAASYTLDRFVAQGQATDGVFTVQQDSTAPNGFSKSLKVTVTTADASIGTTQLYLVGTRIEGNNIADFAFGTSAAKTLALSFWVRSSVTGSFGGAIRNANADRSYPFTYTINAANTWEQKSVTITGDTTGTWANDSTNGMNVHFSIGAGADRIGTAGAWAATNYAGATGQTNLISTLNATWYVTGIQLEIGSAATAFTLAGGNIAGELQAAQRYFYRFGGEDVYNQFCPVYFPTTSTGYGVIQFPTTMRVAPSVTATPTNFAFLYGNNSITACSGNNYTDRITKINFRFNNSVAGTPLTAGNAGVLISNNTTSGFFDISAEL